MQVSLARPFRIARQAVGGRYMDNPTRVLFGEKFLNLSIKIVLAIRPRERMILMTSKKSTRWSGLGESEGPAAIAWDAGRNERYDDENDARSGGDLRERGNPGSGGGLL
jgi:hypothetical protein